MDALDVLREIFAWAVIVAVIAVALAAARSLIGCRAGVVLALSVPLFGAVLVFAHFCGYFLESSGNSLDTVGDHQVVKKHTKQ